MDNSRKSIRKQNLSLLLKIQRMEENMVLKDEENLKITRLYRDLFKKNEKLYNQRYQRIKVIVNDT